MTRLIDAIRNRYLDEAKTLLASGQNNVSANLNGSAVHMLDKHGNGPGIWLRTLVHLTVSTNHPALLEHMIDEHAADIQTLEHNSANSFLEILLNRRFYNKIQMRSALGNLKILFSHGAAIPIGVVQQLFIDFDNLPNSQEYLRPIIRQIYIYKATAQFLNHVRNNQVAQARYVRENCISTMYPELQRLHIAGRINPNYDAGVRGVAVLMAAELGGNNSVQMFEMLRDSHWRPADFSFRNAQGLSVVHRLAMHGNLPGLQWVVDEGLSTLQVVNLLTSTVVEANGARHTPVQLARLHQYPQVVQYLQGLLNDNCNLILQEVVTTQNPDTLNRLEQDGYDITLRHTQYQGNILHYAAMGRVPANFSWIWGKLTNASRLEFLLGTMRYGDNNSYQLLTPLQIAYKLNRPNIIRILNKFAIQLIRVTNAAETHQLVSAGYDLNITNLKQWTAIHYGILGDNDSALRFLFRQMPFVAVMRLITTVHPYYDDQGVLHNESPLQIVRDNVDNAPLVSALFEQYVQLNLQGGPVFNQRALVGLPSVDISLPDPIVVQPVVPYIPQFNGFQQQVANQQHQQAQAPGFFAQQNRI